MGFAPPTRLHYHSPAMRGAPWRAPVGAGRPAMPGVLRRLVYAEKQAIDRIPSFEGIPPVLSAAAEAPPIPARAQG